MLILSKYSPRDSAPFIDHTFYRDNGLIYTANSEKTERAKESSSMDFTHADRDPRKLIIILWKDAMGKRAVPGILLCPEAVHSDITMTCWGNR